MRFPSVTQLLWELRLFVRLSAPEADFIHRLAYLCEQQQKQGRLQKFCCLAATPDLCKALDITERSLRRTRAAVVAKNIIRFVPAPRDTEAEYELLLLERIADSSCLGQVVGDQLPGLVIRHALQTQQQQQAENELSEGERKGGIGGKIEGDLTSPKKNIYSLTGGVGMQGENPPTDDDGAPVLRVWSNLPMLAPPDPEPEPEPVRRGSRRRRAPAKGTSMAYEQACADAEPAALQRLRVYEAWCSTEAPLMLTFQTRLTPQQLTALLDEYNPRVLANVSRSLENYSRFSGYTHAYYTLLKWSATARDRAGSGKIDPMGSVPNFASAPAPPPSAGLPVLEKVANPLSIQHSGYNDTLRRQQERNERYANRNRPGA